MCTFVFSFLAMRSNNVTSTEPANNAKPNHTNTVAQAMSLVTFVKDSLTLHVYSYISAISKFCFCLLLVRLCIMHHSQLFEGLHDIIVYGHALLLLLPIEVPHTLVK